MGLWRHACFESPRLVFGGAFDSSGVKNIFTEEPSNSGTWSVTVALADHEVLHQTSAIKPDNPWVDGAYHLSDILTGRHVLVGNGVKLYMPVSAAHAVISKMFFRTHLVINWALFPDLREAGAGDTIAAVMLANDE